MSKKLQKIKVSFVCSLESDDVDDVRALAAWIGDYISTGRIKYDMPGGDRVGIVDYEVSLGDGTGKHTVRNMSMDKTVAGLFL